MSSSLERKVEEVEVVEDMGRNGYWQSHHPYPYHSNGFRMNRQYQNSYNYNYNNTNWSTHPYYPAVPFLGQPRPRWHSTGWSQGAVGARPYNPFQWTRPKANGMYIPPLLPAWKYNLPDYCMSGANQQQELAYTNQPFSGDAELISTSTEPSETDARSALRQIKPTFHHGTSDSGNYSSFEASSKPNQQPQFPLVLVPGISQSLQSEEIRSRDSRDSDRGVRRNHEKPRSRSPSRCSQIFSEVISVPCEVMSCQRWYIDVGKVPKDYRKKVIDLTRYVRDAYFDSKKGSEGWVHFGVFRYHDMALRLNRLDPPINLGVPIRHGQPLSLPPKVVIAEPRRDRRYDSKRCLTEVYAEQGKLTKTIPNDIKIVDLTISPDQHEGTRTRRMSRSPERRTSAKTKSSKDDRLKLEKESSSIPLAGRLKVSDIPGFEIIQHLIEPYCMRKPPLWGMGCFKKFDVLLSSSRIRQLNAKENEQIVLLRLVLIKSKTGHVADLRDEGQDVMMVRAVEINRHRIYMPKGQAGRLNLDITRYINGGTNSVSVNARISERRDKSLDILCSITIVRRLDARENLNSIKARRHISVERTKKLFARKLMEACENGILVKDSKLPLSLKCPIGKGLIKVPCRGVFCDHFSCFDGLNFLQTFEKSQKWVCPLCDCHIDREDLRIDSFFEMILTSAKPEDLMNDFMIDVGVEGNISKSVPVRKFREEVPSLQFMDTTLNLVSDSEDEYEEALSECGLEVPNSCALSSTTAKPTYDRLTKELSEGEYESSDSETKSQLCHVPGVDFDSQYLQTGNDALSIMLRNPDHYSNDFPDTISRQETPLRTLKEGLENTEMVTNFPQMLSTELLESEASVKISLAKSSSTDVAVSNSIIENQSTQPTEVVIETNHIFPAIVRSESGTDTVKDDFSVSEQYYDAELAALRLAAYVSQIVLPEVMENILSQVEANLSENNCVCVESNLQGEMSMGFCEIDADNTNSIILEDGARLTDNARRHDCEYEGTMSVIPLHDPSFVEIEAILAEMITEIADLNNGVVLAENYLNNGKESENENYLIVKELHETDANTSATATTLSASPIKHDDNDHTYADMAENSSSGDRFCASRTGCTDLKPSLHLNLISETGLKAPDLNLPEAMASLSEALISDEIVTEYFLRNDETVVIMPELNSATTSNKHLDETFTPEHVSDSAFSKKTPVEQEIVVWDTPVPELRSISPKSLAELCLPEFELNKNGMILPGLDCTERDFDKQSEIKLGTPHPSLQSHPDNKRKGNLSSPKRFLTSSPACTRDRDTPIPIPVSSTATTNNISQEESNMWKSSSPLGDKLRGILRKRKIAEVGANSVKTSSSREPACKKISFSN